MEYTTDPATEWGLLALAFPALAVHHRSGASLPGIEPWEPEKLDDWAWHRRNPVEMAAVSFVLHHFDRRENWRVGAFNLKAAEIELSGTPDWLPIALCTLNPVRFLNFLRGTEGVKEPQLGIDPAQVQANHLISMLAQRRRAD